MTNMKPITFYQAANLSDAEVKGQFVVRKKEFDRVMAEIKRDPMKGSIQHYIFIGQRGSGKSTLLRRIQAEINTDEKLEKMLVAVNLSEEQAGIYRLHDLWQKVLEELEILGFETEEVPWETYGNNFTEYAKALYGAIQKTLQKRKMKLVLLLDNFDRVLENIKDDNRLLREILTNHKDLRIIGGSTRLSEHHWKYDQPFYQFFNVIRLESLTQDELKELLLFWGNLMDEPALPEFVRKHPGRLNALRTLSDGMPRTMLNLVELLVNRPDQNGYEYLRSILDKASPIYQERLGILSPLHQKIVLEISFFWDAVKVKQLSAAARVESKTLSAALAQLVEMQIVEKIATKGKNFMYRIRERFFNLWLVMTQGGPSQKNQVKWLTVFLETWYDEQELKDVYKNFTQNLTSGKLTPDKAIIMAKALAHSKFISMQERDYLLDETIKVIGTEKNYLNLLPEKATTIYNRAFQLMGQGKWEEARKQSKKIEQDVNFSSYVDGYINLIQGKLEDAKKTFFNLIKKNVPVYYPLGIIYRRQQNDHEAEKYFSMSLEQGMHESALELGKIYMDKGDLPKAKSYLLTAVENNVKDSEFEIAEFYMLTAEYEEAEKYYHISFKKGEANSIAGLMKVYVLLEKDEKAEQYYNIAKENEIKDVDYEYGMLSYYLNKRKEFIYNLFLNSNDPLIKGVLPIISLWAGKLEVIPEITSLIGYSANKNISPPPLFIREILIHQQKNTVWEWFQNPEWGEKLKNLARPYYYVTAHLMGTKEAEEELLAQAPELAETVKSILAEIKERQQVYYPS